MRHDLPHDVALEPAVHVLQGSPNLRVVRFTEPGEDNPVETELSVMLRGVRQHLLGRAQIQHVRCPLENLGLDIYPAIVPQPAAHELLVGPLFEKMLDDLGDSTLNTEDESDFGEPSE